MRKPPLLKCFLESIHSRVSIRFWEESDPSSNSSIALNSLKNNSYIFRACFLTWKLSILNGSERTSRRTSESNVHFFANSAMKEGELVFAKEPIITYSGPISIVQLFETPILNLVGFASLVATNASRMVKAVEPKECMEFGIRRAQGPDGALSASEYSYLGGFKKTSNLTAGIKLGIPCVGTMSHAYVTSFSSIEDALDFSFQGVNIKDRALHYKK